MSATIEVYTPCKHCKQSRTHFRETITSNYWKFARSLGLYDEIYDEEKKGPRRAGDLVEALDMAIQWVKLDKERLRIFEDKYCDLSGFIKFLKKYRSACKRHPNALVERW